MDWITRNKNRDAIIILNKIIKNIAESTNYDDIQEVSINSILVRSLFKTREKLYQEGLNNEHRLL